MPSPFPGMDPYLETPKLWRDVHSNLIVASQESLNRSLRPSYVARVELRIYVENEQETREIIPDVRIEKTNGKGRRSSNGSAVAIAEPVDVPVVFDEPIEEARLEIKDVKTGALVAVIEFLSPSNKVRGSEGRNSFMRKRRETAVSEAHWVEIDLLRAGTPSQLFPDGSDYRVLVSKGGEFGRGRLWAINVRQPLPIIGIPLRTPDADVPLDLGAVLSTAYDRAAYDRSIDFDKPPNPPLAKDDAKWADKLLRAHGVR